MREDEIWQQALAELRQPVAQVFFLSEKSAKQLREHTGDNYIDYQLPHYLLEDGRTLYGKSGWSVAKEVWWAEAEKTK